MNFKITLGVAVVICTLVSIESITLPASGLEPTYVPHSEHMYVPKSGSENLIQAPHGIDIDTSGNIYISDSNNFIEKFDSNGKFITKWGSNGTGNGQFHDPHGIAVDPSGYVYVVDTFNFRVQKFDSNGKFITKWGSNGTGNGQFLHPHDVAVDPSGFVYVGDYYIPNIQKFDSNGKFITKWGSKGNGDGKFAQKGLDAGVEGIGVEKDSGNVFIADSGNSRVQKFDSNGKFITKWGSKGNGDGKFNHNHYIAVDSSGSVYEADRDNGYFQKFDSNGKFITKWGSKGNDGPR